MGHKVLRGDSFAIAPARLSASSERTAWVNPPCCASSQAMCARATARCCLNEALHCGEATNAPGQQVVLQLRTPPRLQCDQGGGSHNGGHPAIFFCSSFFALLLASKIFLPSRNRPFSAGEEHDTSEKWERIRDHTRSKVNQAISSPLFWNGLLVEALFCVTLLVSQNRWD